MKIQTTKKHVKANFATVVSVPVDVWADVADALRLVPSAYTVGVYGHTDIYVIGNVAVTVSTGGRSFGTAYSRDNLCMWRDISRLAQTDNDRANIIRAIAHNMRGDNPLWYHHSALARGYVSRKGTAYREAYRGRFGIGVKVHRQSYGMTSHHRIEYYVI